MKDFYVVDPRENYRGLPYGYWAALWCKWLMSQDPERYLDDIIFLRGNVDYKPAGGVTGAPPHIDPKGIYDRTGKKGETIFVETPIFFPVVNALIVGGHTYDGRLIKTEDDMRRAARQDTSEGREMWVIIERLGSGRPRSVVRNLNDFLIESPIFHLNVTRESKLRSRMESSLEPGIFECVTIGYYILLIIHVPSTYRLRFGGKGRGIYRTDAIYDIKVLGRRCQSIPDVSSRFYSKEKSILPNNSHSCCY